MKKLVLTFNRKVLLQKLYELSGEVLLRIQTGKRYRHVTISDMK